MIGFSNTRLGVPILRITPGDFGRRPYPIPRNSVWEPGQSNPVDPGGSSGGSWFCNSVRVGARQLKSDVRQKAPQVGINTGVLRVGSRLCASMPHSRVEGKTD
jgi:hypothetical protein